jgi:hypothetical protein
MRLDLAPLFARAFMTTEAARATPALAEARDENSGRFYEVIVPPEPDVAWFEGSLIGKLVYHCEATRAPLPGCGNVLVAFFVGDTLHGVRAADVIAFACEALGTSPASLVERFGTGEVRHALRGPIR